MLSDRYQLSKIHAKTMGEEEDDITSRLRERNSLGYLLERALLELKNSYVLQKIKVLKKEMKESDTDRQLELIEELKKLQELKIILAKNLGDRVVLRF